MLRWGRGILFAGLAAGLLALGGVRAASAAVTVSVVNELTTRGVRSEQSSLADVFADAIRSLEKSDIAFLPAASFRADVTVPKGSATAEDLLKALEVRDDQVVIMKLTGAQVRKGLEHGLSIFPQASMQFLQVSGISFGFAPGAKSFARVSSASVGGEAVSADRRYRVAMTSALANGDYGYFTVWGGALKPVSNGQTIAQAVTKFLAGRGTLDYRSQNRIMKL